MQYIFKNLCIIAEKNTEVHAVEHFTKELKKRDVVILSEAKKGK